jgi:hypothetical protein
MPKAQVQAIAKAITSTLNHVVSACVMNQSRGHWLLSNASTISITIIMEMEAQLLELSIGLEISYLFETKIFLLHRNMRLEVIKVIKPFLEFMRSFDVRQAHNMTAIMLDPCFKALRIMANLVRRRNAIRLAFEYDVKVVVPLLMVCFDWLNPIASTSVIVAIDATGSKLEENMFRLGLQLRNLFYH